MRSFKNDVMEVHVLEIEFSFGGKKDRLYPVVLQSGEELLLVDCGYEGFLPLIESAMTAKGLRLSQLTGIIVTHHDIDHMGGLHEMREALPEVVIYAAAAEAPFIDGSRKSLRLQQAEDMYDLLPEDQKAGARYFQQLLQSMKPVKVDLCFSEKQLPAVFVRHGITIVETPGHMPGHVSIYLPQLHTLIAADAVVLEHGEPEIANPQFTLDMPAAVESVRKLSKLAVDRMICYHGGLTEGNIPERLGFLAETYDRAGTLHSVSGAD